MKGLGVLRFGIKGFGFWGPNEISSPPAHVKF